MNRRNFFSFLGIGSAGVLIPKAFAKSASHDDMWVNIHCKNKIDTQSKIFSKPNFGDINDAQDRVHMYIELCGMIGGDKNLEGLRYAEKTLQDKWQEYNAEISKWESLETCNCSYKRLLGTHVNCPKCGELSIGFTGRDSGVAA